MSSVLIVEDDDDIRELLAEILSRNGYLVACASNGQDALEQLRHGASACLILLDLMMPVMDGWEFRRRQRQDPALSNIPFAVISGAASDAKRSIAKESVGCFSKPLDIKAVLATVGRHCRPATAAS